MQNFLKSKNPSLGYIYASKWTLLLMESFHCETPHTRLHSATAVVVENLSLVVSSIDDCNLCFNCYSLYSFSVWMDDDAIELG